MLEDKKFIQMIYRRTCERSVKRNYIMKERKKEKIRETEKRKEKNIFIKSRNEKDRKKKREMSLKKNCARQIVGTQTFIDFRSAKKKF